MFVVSAALAAMALACLPEKAKAGKRRESITPPAAESDGTGGCGSRPISTPDSRPRPSLAEVLETCSQEEQEVFVAELAKSLSAESPIELILRVEKPPVSSWGKLVRELLLREKRSLLRGILRKGMVRGARFEEAAGALGERGDLEALEVLTTIIDGAPTYEEGNPNPSDCRSSAILSLVSFLSHPKTELGAFQKLARVLKEDEHSTNRGLSAIALGSSRRSEAVQVLNAAVHDKGSVDIDHNESADWNSCVGGWARKSLDQVEKRLAEPGR
jgi:hypothetical protein